MGIHELPPQESSRFRRSWNEFQEVLNPIEKDTKAPKQIRDRILGLRTALGKLRSSDDTRAFVQILGQAHELASEFRSAPAEETSQELPEIEIASGEASSSEENSLYEKPWTVSLDAAHYSASANLTPAESRNRLKALIARMKPEIAQEPREETGSERVARLAASQGVSPRLASREFERVQKTEKESPPVEPSPVEHAEAIGKDERSEPAIVDPSFSAVKDRIDPKFSEAAPLERKVDLGPLPETFPDTKVDWKSEESDEAAQMRAGFHKGPERGAALFDESRKADLGPLPERYPDTKVHWEEGESEEAAAMRAALHKGPPAKTEAGGEVSPASMDFGNFGLALEAGALRARKEAWAVKLAKGARLGKARNEMLSAERIRLDAEYDFYAKRSLVGRWLNRRTGGEETRAIAETDAVYAAKAFAFEQKLEKRLASHLAKRKKEGMSAEEAEEFEKKFSARYRRMVISRDVIDHGEERLTAMRDRAFGKKEKTVVEKGLALYLRQNAALEHKLGKEAARAVRILGFSVAGATLAAPFGAAFGVSAIGLRFARSLAGTVLGGAVGAGAGKGYEKRFGAAARRSLTGARENAASTEEAFAAKRHAYRKGNERAIERKRRITEALSAALVGAGVSVEAAHLLAGHEAVQKAAEHALGSTKVLEHHTLGSGVGHALESKTASVSPSAAAQPAFESPVVHAERGLGYEHMLKELRADLMKQGHAAADFPKGSDAYALLSADDSHLNTELYRLASNPAHHFFNTESGRSVTVHVGATLSVDKGGVAHFSADGTSPGAAAAPEHAATTPAHHAPADQRSITAKLNEEELLKVQEGNAANAAWHAAHPDVSSTAPAAPPAEASATHAPAPLHAHANAADTSHEAPSAEKPAVSEAVNRAAEHALEKGLPFENHNGVVVDPAHVGGYRYEYNGRKILFVSGGGLSEDDFQGRLDYIHDTLAKDPQLRGAHVFVDATQLKPDGSTEPAVGELLITDDGQVNLIRGTVENVFTGKKMPLPDPDSFTNRYLPPADGARTS